MNLDALHFRAISKVFFEGLISRLLTRARQATGFVGYLFAPLLVAGHVFLEAKKQHEQHGLLSSCGFFASWLVEP